MVVFVIQCNVIFGGWLWMWMYLFSSVMRLQQTAGGCSSDDQQKRMVAIYAVCYMLYG